MWQRLIKKLEGYTIPGLIRDDQITSKSHQFTVDLGEPILVGRVVFPDSLGWFGRVKNIGTRGQRQLPAAQFACHVHHDVNLGTGQNAARMKQD